MLIESTHQIGFALGMLDGIFKAPNGAEISHIVLRWLHFVAGITWIGLLYFFNLVNVPLQKGLDADTKKKVNPQLLLPALWYFRWGALVTVLALGHLIFNLHIAGSLILLLALSIPFILASLSLGLLISTVAQNQGQAMQLAFLTILPSIFFSGYIFPRETMPWFFHTLSYFVPATYFINITRGIILRGAAFQHLWLDALALFTMGTLLLIIAGRKFSNKGIMA